MEMKKKCIVIPDVHGRKFWRKAVRGNEDKRIIFLGDYLDPYRYEGISYIDAMEEFVDILAIKKKHPDNVTLLLGNHDIGYIDPYICDVIQDVGRRDFYRKLILDNISLFDMVALEWIGGETILFSHAGIRTGWLRHNDWLFDEDSFCPEVLNDLLHDDEGREDLLLALADVSSYRGGLGDAGSVIWTDIYEFLYNNDELPGYVQMFGHSLHKGGPWRIDDHLWCLDCGKAFTVGSSRGNASIEIKEIAGVFVTDNS